MAVLLLGNGINQKEDLVCSWDDLLKRACSDDIIKKGESVPPDLLPSVEGLTMTLGFELQEFYAVDNHLARDGTDLKRKIAESMQKRILEKVSGPDFDWKNTLHRQIMGLKADTILTTNYDYALEASVCPDFKSSSGSRETIYSRYRHHTVNVDGRDKKVFHIHGEMHVPRSICLGFEQYSGALEKMRSDLVRTTKNKEDPSDRHTYHLRDVMQGIGKADGSSEDDGAWYLRFFREDIYILGLRLDFSEQDLWWLLDFRIRKLRYEEDDLGIRNHIFFFDSDASSVKEEGRYGPRNDLLRAFGAEIIYLDGPTYEDKYLQALERLKADLEP